MDNNEIYEYNYVLNQLGKRIFPQFFYERNPDLMDKWQNQICRQSHILVSYYLDTWLNTNDKKGYKIEFYEGIFIDTVTKGQYDHSWVYIKNIYNEKEQYICDIARISEHIGFKPCIENNPSLFISDQLILIKKIDWKSMINKKEYYTGLTGNEIINFIDKRLKQSNLWINN